MFFEKCSDSIDTWNYSDVDMVGTKWPDVMLFVGMCIDTCIFLLVCPLISVCLEKVLFVIND